MATTTHEVVSARPPLWRDATVLKWFSQIAMLVLVVGGLAFMVRGSMCVGVNGEELMARVGPEQYDESLTLPDARQMDFTGRPMKGFIFVGTDGTESDGDLGEWVDRCLSFNATLAAK